MTFHVHCLQLGNSANFCITHAHVWREGKNGVAYFGGDAYWQWMVQPGYPYRNHKTGFCWAQALYDGLNGPHQEAFLRGDEFAVVVSDSDYAHVARIVDVYETGVEVPEGF